MSYAHPEYLISPAQLAEDPSGWRILDAAVFLTPAPNPTYS